MILRLVEASRQIQSCPGSQSEPFLNLRAPRRKVFVFTGVCFTDYPSQPQGPTFAGRRAWRTRTSGVLARSSPARLTNLQMEPTRLTVRAMIWMQVANEIRRFNDAIVVLGQWSRLAFWI
jgi:hypothetical protein